MQCQIALDILGELYVTNNLRPKTYAVSRIRINMSWSLVLNIDLTYLVI